MKNLYFLFKCSLIFSMSNYFENYKVSNLIWLTKLKTQFCWICYGEIGVYLEWYKSRKYCSDLLANFYVSN
jgi:hypothetical protein